MQLRATRLTAIAHAVRDLFRGASLRMDFTKTEAIDPRITFTRASNATRINSAGVLELVSTNGPRFDYDPVTLQPKGLLIEEQRTNSIRNNTMQGAVAGTPGTLPTNWSSSFGGLSQEIVGTGYEDGVAYIDIRYSGTTTVASTQIRFEASDAVAAANNQIFAISAWVRVVGGNATNITTQGFGGNQFDVSIAYLGDAVRTGAWALTDSLTRVRQVLTINNAATAFIRPYFVLSHSVGVPIDITLRIGMPQLELGAFATSVIPTTTAAATRAADVAVMTGANFSNWYRQDEGTLFGEVSSAAPTVSGVSRRIANVNNGTGSNRIGIGWAGLTGVVAAFVTDGGVVQAAFNSQSGAYPFPTKVGLAYKANDFAAAVNGSAFASDTSGSIPVVDRMTIGDMVGPQNLNGHISRIAYYPRRLSNAELQGITS